MFDVTTLPFKDLSPVTVETALLKEPQASCPVVHRFGPGIYIRELHMSAGTMAVGKLQKYEHTNILLKGKVMMFNENGTTSILEAPLFFVGKSGRKVGLVLEDVVWQNIYATEETDIDKLEEMLLENSEAGKEHQLAQLAFAKIEAQNDNDDYQMLLEDIGMTEEQVQQEVQSSLDIVDFDTPNTLRVTDSPIHGKGLFTTTPIYKDDLIAKARIGHCRTPAGRYTNHSAVPNCTFVVDEFNNIWLKALEDIDGCMGGSKGTELTVDYRIALKLNKEITCLL
jgi:hypothetical protein